jgi:hypothetical protein
MAFQISSDNLIQGAKLDISLGTKKLEELELET